jgi:hypothetical protein
VNSLSLPRTTPWSAGEKPNAKLLNEIQDALEFLIEPPQVRVITGPGVSNQTITTSTWTAVNFSEVQYDNLAPFGLPSWSSADPSGVYIRVPGWYEINMQTSWDTNATACRVAQIMTINAVGSPWGNDDLPFGRYDEHHRADYQVVQSEVPRFLAAGDKLQMWAFHDRGANWDLINGTQWMGIDAGWRYGRVNMLQARWVSL